MEAIAWPRDFPEFKKLDNLLRCGICYEYIKTCMITSCSHNYCSLCIRKYMQYKTACPACFEETYEVNLRNNRPIDEIISIYCAIRDKLFRHLRLSTVHIQPSQNDELKSVENLIKDTKIISESNENVTSPILKRSKIPETFKKSIKSAQNVKKKLDDSLAPKVHPEENLYNDLKPSIPNQAVEDMPSTSRSSPVKKIPVIFYSPKKSGTVGCTSPANAVKVPCPVCNVDIPERNINGHLDSCLARDGAPKSVAVSSRRSPIPKRVYSMMSEKDLRKWLKTYGLNTMGDKKALINRIQRYTVLYNSDCDSDHPRPPAEIIRQVEMEEKQEKGTNFGNMSSAVRKINKNSDQKIIEEENKKYLEKNKASFDNLIKSMRERNGTSIKPTKRINVISDSDESDVEIDSYFSKETMRIVDDSPRSSDQPNNDKKMTRQKKGKSGTNEVDVQIDVHFLAQSPDLSANQNESLIDMIEFSESPKENSKCCNQLESKDREADYNSDESDNSISLLANCEIILQENKSSPILFGNKKSPALTESQIIDPDFMVTESQWFDAKEDDSEEEFTPKRRMKRSKITTNQKTPTSSKKSTPRFSKQNVTPKVTQSQIADPDFLVTESQLKELSDDCDSENVESTGSKQSVESDSTESKLSETESRGSQKTFLNESDEPSSSESKSSETESRNSQPGFPDVENIDPDSLKQSKISLVGNSNINDRTSSLRNKRQRNVSASEIETPKRILRQRTK